MHSPNTPRRQFLQAGAAAAASLALPALAQSYPAKPIKLICPWPAGGSSDMVMRALAESASKAIGGQVVIENKAGASGMLGPNELVKATPDGYTLSQVTIGVARLPHMQKMQFDPLKDFTYIVCLTGYTFGIVVKADSPFKTIKDLVAYAKANPGKINYATAGPASFGHLASVLFARTAGVTLEHIPYKGQAPTTQAVLAGEVQMLLSTSSAQMNAFIKEGRVRLLGVSSAQPSPLVPGGVPINQTLPNFQADVWFGLFAPAGTPRDVVAKLNDAIGKALQQPDVKTKFETAGSLPVGSTPEQMVARITEESANWAAIVRDVNIKAE